MQRCAIWAVSPCSGAFWRTKARPGLGMLWGCWQQKMGGTRSTGEKKWVERSGQKKGVCVCVWEPTREEAILAEVICALLSAHYLIWGRLAPARVTGVAQAEKLCLGQPRWSLTAPLRGLPGTGHCPRQDRAPGSCRQHPPPDTGGTPGYFSAGGAKPKGPPHPREGTGQARPGGPPGAGQQSETPRPPPPPLSPGLRARQAGPAAAAGPADAAISADTVWRVPASPPGGGGFNPPPECSPNTPGARRNAARPGLRGAGLGAGSAPLPPRSRAEQGPAGCPRPSRGSGFRRFPERPAWIASSDPR